MFEHFRGDWEYAEPSFFDELSKSLFFKIFTLVLWDGFLDSFWKFRLFKVQICILIWYFWVFFENYSIYSKSRVTGPWDHMVSVSAKKSKKNFMVVYLSLPISEYQCSLKTVNVLFNNFQAWTFFLYPWKIFFFSYLYFLLFPWIFLFLQCNNI